KWLFTRIRKGKKRVRDLRKTIHNIEIAKKGISLLKEIEGASIFDILTEIFNIPRENTGNMTIIRKKLLASAELK
ncbi:MAG: hypothetical protein JXB60_07890, partial [Candidatus Cloacimonetes bacterium]|nr:hypothetical protein [Candidatus Cloacimonadota bacterium]